MELGSAYKTSVCEILNSEDGLVLRSEGRLFMCTDIQAKQSHDLERRGAALSRSVYAANSCNVSEKRSHTTCLMLWQRALIVWQSNVV